MCQCVRAEPAGGLESDQIAGRVAGSSDRGFFIRE
jgi:hypothetical protein